MVDNPTTLEGNRRHYYYCMNPSLREEDKEQHCGEITLLYCFIAVCSVAPVPTPTYFLGPRELTAPESQMNSTFLPSWAVTSPHTAEARLINETQQDVGSRAGSYVWNEESDGDLGWMVRGAFPPPLQPQQDGPPPRWCGRPQPCGEQTWWWVLMQRSAADEGRGFRFKWS